MLLFIKVIPNTRERNHEERKNNSLLTGNSITNPTLPLSQASNKCYVASSTQMETNRINLWKCSVIWKSTHWRNVIFYSSDVKCEDCGIVSVMPETTPWQMQLFRFPRRGHHPIILVTFYQKAAWRQIDWGGDRPSLASLRSASEWQRVFSFSSFIIDNYYLPANWVFPNSIL